MQTFHKRSSMLKSLINRIFKTKLAAKVWILIVIPTLAVLLFIDISLDLYFDRVNIENSINDAEKDTAYVASSFSETYTDIIDRFVRKTSTDDFQKQFLKMMRCDQSEFTTVNNALQSLFTDYKQMNNLIESVLFVKKSTDESPDLFFRSYDSRLKNEISTFNLGYDLSQVSKITLLPHSPSPFSQQPEVLPIVLPLDYVSVDTLILLAGDIKKTDILLYLFLDTSDLKDYFELYCNDKSQGLLYLVNSSGQNMSLPDSVDGTKATNTSVFSSVISSAVTNHETYLQTSSQHIFIRQIADIDLYLVNVIPHEQFTAKSDNTRAALFWIAIISVLIITVLSFLISIFVTNPLKKLMVSVHDIKSNTYHGIADITAKDEIGQLSESIDSMYNTIQLQISSIKQEEKEKYNTKMQLLSEQIKPHFLYNALEFINMEVYNNHTETASRMITSLGDYLRISLAYGENQLLILQEIEQVLAYINIMNYRFHHNIMVNTKIPESLLHQKIVKCILQPLVENSLKHGFKVGSGTGFPITPMIDISMTLDEEHLTLIVSDNGAGIDIDKATQIMLNKQTDDSEDIHFGLNNIYERLSSFYGTISINFESIPFFENKVIIKLPAEFFQ